LRGRSIYPSIGKGKRRRKIFIFTGGKEKNRGKGIRIQVSLLRKVKRVLFRESRGKNGRSFVSGYKEGKGISSFYLTK